MTILKAALIGLCAVVGGGAALAAPPSDFAATDAKLQACEARDSSNAHMEACLSIA